MKRSLAAALLALAVACAPDKTGDFELGLLSPVGPGVEAAAPTAGLVIRSTAPEGADVRSVGLSMMGVSGRMEERLDDWARLRLLVASALVRRRTGVFFSLPQGRELTAYPEEWQALARAAREMAALRAIVESGVDVPAPFTVPDAVKARAWRFRGRLYVLLVNEAALDAPISENSLKSWRALFEVRADARELLIACGGELCLPAGRVLWLEGRF